MSADSSATRMALQNSYLWGLLTNLEKRAQALSKAFESTSLRANEIDRRFSEHIDRIEKEEIFVTCLSKLHQLNTRLACLFLHRMRETYREIAAFIRGNNYFQQIELDQGRRAELPTYFRNSPCDLDPRWMALYGEIWNEFKLDEHHIYLLSIIGNMVVESKRRLTSDAKINEHMKPTLLEMDNVITILEEFVTDEEVLSFLKVIMRRAQLADEATLLDESYEIN